VELSKSTAPARNDINIFLRSASAHNKYHRSVKCANIESIIPTEACFPLLSSPTSIDNYSLPNISHKAQVMAGD
jgi:hypothetical protein